MEVQIEKEIIPTPSRELIEKEEKMWGSICQHHIKIC
jgi:hypothetical protein